MFLNRELQSNGSLDELLKRRLLIHTGKGGVGRSVLTASIARLAAAQGKRVLICEVNAKERMSSLLGGDKPESFSTLDEIWQPQENIWAVNIRPWPGMKEYVTEVLRMRLVFNLVFENGVMRYFLRAIPGLQELVFMGKAWFHVTQTLPDGSPRFDLVIVDAPATGHGIAMLRIPEVILDVAPPGPMHTAAERIRDLLHDPQKTWVNLVTLPEEMPVNETIELYSKVTDMLGLSVGCTWVNQCPERLCSPEQWELFQALRHSDVASQSSVWPYFAAGEFAHTLHSKAEHHIRILRDAVPVPTLCIPRVNAQEGANEIEISEQLVPHLHDALTSQNLGSSV